MPIYKNFTSKHLDPLMTHDVVINQVGSNYWIRYICTAKSVMHGEDGHVPFDMFSTGEIITCLMCLGLASLRRRGGVTDTGLRIGY